MPVIFGDTLAGWVIRIVGAILIFLLIRWLLPMLMEAVGFPVPDQIITVLTILCALIVLFSRLWWPGSRAAA